MFIQVVFPLPFRNAFTYRVPEELENEIKIGIRIVASFGRRVLTGFVIDVSDTTNVKGKIKPIFDVLDSTPIFNKESLKFYEWLAEYYLSSLGEALKNTVPYGIEIESKKKIIADRSFCRDLFQKIEEKNSTKAKLLKILSQKEIHRISQLQKEVRKKSIYAMLKSLERKGAVTIIDEIAGAKVKIKRLKFVRLAQSIDEIYEYLPDLEKKSPKQIVILLELLSNKEKEIQLSELLKKTHTHQASINSLMQKGLIKVFDKEVERVYFETYHEEFQKIKLTDQQQKIIDEVNTAVSQKEFKPYLLHGITGSGKTQVYIELTKRVLAIGKNAIILVPEISLTPQITSRFYNNFGNKVAVIHSRMSLGERYDAWRGIIAGKFNVVIGPRSALFAPLKDVGLIVVDEEHDASYKQFENVPKYNARDTAIIKAKFIKCPIVLGSATPSIESMYNASIGKYQLLELKERVDNAQLPKIHLVNVIIEKKKKRMENIFSHELLKEIKKRIEKKEGIIILQNRRGFATQIYCEDCGEIMMCDNCSVSMVHHLYSNSMRCHYCGAVKPVPKVCPNCGSLAIKFFGTGTQRVEDELAYYFPNIKIERVDSDTMNKKGKLGIILNSFRKGEIDVLVGTQMVSKGLDFSNVTLVGVISAETTLWLPDFRADERTFQLLTQVAGRSGRSKSKGEVIIQTRDHRHFVLQKVLTNNYNDFYKKELQMRRINGYPPFTRLVLIETRNEDERKAGGAINSFYKILIKQSKLLTISPPHEAIISKIKRQYRFQIIVKSDRTKDIGGKILHNVILNSFISFNRTSHFRNVKIIFDIDPQSII